MKNIVITEKYFGKWAYVLFIWVLLVGFPSQGMGATANASGNSANRLKTSLTNAGIQVTSATVSDDGVIIGYRQSVSEISGMDEMLTKIATILATVSHTLSGSYKTTIRQTFDDGQVMEVTGNSADGQGYLDGSISSGVFREKLDLNPRTRGPILVSGTCNPGQGDNCRNNPACGCYPNEICDPGNAAADGKGCVSATAPPNAHLSGTQYVCNTDYEWNNDLTACVPEVKCGEHAFEFQGECQYEEGYECMPDDANTTTCCSSLNLTTLAIEVPCFRIEENTYSLFFSHSGGALFKLERFAQLDSSPCNAECCGSYDFATGLISLPCIMVGEYSFWTTFSLIVNDDGIFLNLLGYGAR